MAKYDLLKDFEKDGWVQHFVFDSMKAEIFEQKDFNGQEMDIKLIINGVECPLQKTLEHIGSQFEKAVEDKARELIREEYLGRIEQVESLLHEVREKAKDIIDTGRTW